MPDVSRVTVANTVFESLNFTVPVGVIVAEELTLALKVMLCPSNAGLTDDVKVVVVGRTPCPTKFAVTTLLLVLL